MAATMESLGLDRLSPDEKLALAGQLWDSVLVAKQPGSFLDDEQRAELRRRIAEAEATPDDYVKWKDVLADTLKRFSK
ncbi:MAG: addiction module protein [Planctomycetes bacterium]|jgi:putative addiction module component (TIGR02574 family)|nr:addiction module protein [Planctomycetota bacterium]